MDNPCLNLAQLLRLSAASRTSPLFYVRAYNLRVNEIETMYERSKKLKKLNLPQLSTFTRDTSYSLCFICVDNSMICSDIWHKYHR